MAKKDLSAALGEALQISTSIGPIEVKKFNLGSMARASSQFAKLASAFSILEDESVRVDAPTLFYCLAEDDMGAIFGLVELATGIERDRLEALEIDEGFDLIKAVFNHSILPIVKKLKELKPK